MKRWIMTAVLILFTSVVAHAQTVAAQLNATDDGFIWFDNPTGQTQQLAADFYGTSGYMQTCGGTIPPYTTQVACFIPSGARWALVNTPFIGYTYFTGNRLYAVTPGYNYFGASAFTGIALVNAAGGSLPVSIILYDGNGQYEDSTGITLGAYWTDARFAYQWFPNANWNATHFIEITSFPVDAAVLKVICNPATWVCSQV